MRRYSGFTRVSSLGDIATFVGSQGGSIERAARRAGLPQSLLQLPEELVPLREQFRLLECAARETGDVAFGARLGRGVRIENLSAFGRVVGAAHTLAEAIDTATANLHRMLQTSTLLRLQRRAGKAFWSVEIHEPVSPGRYQHELLALCYMIDITRKFAGRSWRPESVLTTAATGTPVAATEDAYGCSVRPGYAAGTIVFDEALLGRGAMRPRHAGHGADGTQGIEPRVPANGDFSGTVTALAALALLDGPPRIDGIAAQLGLTRRTLQRRLDDAGTTFSAVLAAARRERAVALVAATAVPLTEVAFRLGYQDPAHFTRAFRRWTGLAPSAYRLKQGRSDV